MEKTSLMSSDVSFRPGFSILHQTIGSIKKKKEVFDLLLSSLHADLDAMLFTETWLRNTDMSPELTNYSAVRMNRAGRGGGLGVYLKHQHSFQILDAFAISNGDIECLPIETNSFLLTLVHRPPSGYKRRFKVIWNNFCILLLT